MSRSSDSEDEKNKNKGDSEAFSLSEQQLATVSQLVKSAVSAAVAQVLPLAQLNHNTSGQASPGTSAQTKFDSPSNGFSDSRNQNESMQEDGEVIEDELDEYEKELRNLLGDAKVTGPNISEKVSRLLEKCLCNPLDEKVVKLKRDAYPRPDHVSNLKVPRTNPLIFF